MKIGISSIFNRLAFESKFGQDVKLITDLGMINELDLIVIPSGVSPEIDTKERELEEKIISTAVSKGKRIFSTGNGTIKFALFYPGSSYFVSSVLSEKYEPHPGLHELEFSTSSDSNIFYRFFKGKKVVSNHHLILPAHQRTWGSIGCTYKGAIEGIFSRKIISCVFQPELMAGSDLFNYIKNGWEETAPTLDKVINLSDLNEVDFQIMVQKISGGWR